MGTFTLSSCLLENINKTYYKIPFTFIQPQSLNKIAIDNEGRIYDIYKEIGKKNEIIGTWLLMMGNDPSSFTPIDIEIDSEFDNTFIFLEVCKNTVEKKMIVNSHQNWHKILPLNDSFIGTYCSFNINFIDKDQCLKIFDDEKLQINQLNIGSNVANDESSISNSKANSNFTNNTLFQWLKKKISK